MKSNIPKNKLIHKDKNKEKQIELNDQYIVIRTESDAYDNCSSVNSKVKKSLKRKKENYKSNILEASKPNTNKYAHVSSRLFENKKETFKLSKPIDKQLPKANRNKTPLFKKHIIPIDPDDLVKSIFDNY